MVKLKIYLELSPAEIDILIKSLDFFKTTSNIFDNGEYEVTVEEIRRKLLDNLIQAGIEKE